MSKKQTRQPVFANVCGAPQHGKSYFVNQKLQMLNRRTIVIDNSMREEKWLKYPTISLRDKEDCETFTGIRYTCVKWYDSPEEVFKLIDLHCNDVQLVFDDSRPYIGKHIGNDFHFINVMTNRRQRGIDIWNINHSIEQIPLAFIDYIEILVLFYTADSPDSAARRLKTDLVKEPIKELKKIKASIVKENDPRKYSKKILKIQ